MQMGLGGPQSFPTPLPPTYVPDPRFNARYQNVYGTQVGASVSPTTRRGSLDLQFPIGDHQQQLFLRGGAYAQPGSDTTSPDWGFNVGFTKKIAPQGMSVGDALNKAIQQNIPGSSSEVMNTSARTPFFNSLTPEQLQMLGQDARAIQRRSVDEQLGIIPGAEKFSFKTGVDVRNIEQDSSGNIPQMSPAGFARNYAGGLQQGGLGSIPSPQPNPSITLSIPGMMGNPNRNIPPYGMPYQQ